MFPLSVHQYWLISLVDSAVFIAHCDAVGRYEEVTRRLKELDDMLDETPQGYVVQHALFTVRNKLWDQVIRSAQEFGLSPAARSRVKETGQQQLPLGDGWDNV